MVAAALISALSGGTPEQRARSWESHNPRVYDRTGPYLWMARTRRVESGPGIRLDGRGLPLDAYPEGYFYNPVSISQYGLGHYGRWLRHRRVEDRTKALRAADWLVSNQAGDGRWLYRFDYTVGGMGSVPGATLSAPWSSAMAQGEGISLLVRSWRLTRDPDHLRAARKAVRPLSIDVSRGGLRQRLAGGTFFEEYPTTPPSHVLNGFMFTVIGLWDLSPWSPEAAELYAKSRKTLVRALPLYDRGAERLSAYHLGFRSAGQPVVTSTGYHWVHREQLRALAGIDPDPVISDFVKRWRMPST